VLAASIPDLSLEHLSKCCSHKKRHQMILWAEVRKRQREVNIGSRSGLILRMGDCWNKGIGRDEDSELID